MTFVKCFIQKLFMSDLFGEWNFAQIKYINEWTVFDYVDGV